jgi:hypothetical protein
MMSNADNNQQQPVWAIVEIMGHDRTAGKFSRDGSLIRIDVPNVRPDAAPDSYLTEMIGEGAIFRIRFVDEEAARFVARSLQPQPIGVWELRQEIKRLAAPPVIEQEPDEEYANLHELAEKLNAERAAANRDAAMVAGIEGER